MLRQAVRAVVPPPWREAIRNRLYLLLHPDQFHLYPYHLFSRYHRPQSVLEWLAYEARFHAWRLTRGRGARLERPIFMVGCPRSGTSVSVRLFALHPEVANLSEAFEIWDPWHYDDRESEHAWGAADVTPANARRLHARFEFHRRHHRRARFINKDPRNSVRIDYVRAVFPDAVFLHVIRDGRAVAASIMQFIQRRPPLQSPATPLCRPRNWRELVRADRLEQEALEWRAVVSCVLSKRAELGAAYYEFKYEDLCDDPRGVLGAAFRYAGLRADGEVLGLLPERLESQNYKWRKLLTPQQIEMVTSIQAPLLTELGYPL